MDSIKTQILGCLKKQVTLSTLCSDCSWSLGFLSLFFFQSKSCLNKGNEPFHVCPLVDFQLQLKKLKHSCIPGLFTASNELSNYFSHKFQRTRRFLDHLQELAKPFLGRRDEAEGDGVVVRQGTSSFTFVRNHFSSQAVIKRHVFCEGLCLGLSAIAPAEVKSCFLQRLKERDASWWLFVNCLEANSCDAGMQGPCWF